jgi:diguanylate cyclase (GGDEF)-like protein/PAS domain S-box-containing protein
MRRIRFKDLKYSCWLAAVALFFAVGIWFSGLTAAPLLGTVRVGVDQSPPFYELQPDGSVKGLAVDVLEEAAHRRGIRIIWTPLRDIPLDTALETGVADLWPLVAPTSDRRRKFFLSDPWLESDFVLISLKGRPVRDSAGAAGQTIAHARLKTTTGIATKYLSRSRFVVKMLRSEVVQAVCRDEAAAGLIESRLLDAILLDRPKGCENAAFTISSLHDATVSLSLMSTKEYARTARVLREEITRLANNGFLSAKLDEWTPFSAEGTRSIWAAKASEVRTRTYQIAFSLILAVSFALLYMSRRTHLARKAAERAELERKASEQRWQLALTSSGDALWDWDLTSNTIFRSPRWKTMLGYRDEEIGATFEAWKDLLHPQDLARVSAALEEHLQKLGSGYSVEYRLLHKDGSWVWILDRGQAFWNDESSPTRMTGSHSDVTQRKAAEVALEIMATTDPLTGLRNRRELDRIFDGMLHAKIQVGGKLSVCVCDLDWFKQVNDQFGHAMGDKVLIGFAQQLIRGLRQTDVAARAGGDEFVILLPETSKAAAVQIMERIAAEMREMSFGPTVDKEFQVSCSFGIAELEAEHKDASQLMAAADRMLYVAKNGRFKRLTAVAS